MVHNPLSVSVPKSPLPLLSNTEEKKLFGYNMVHTPLSVLLLAKITTFTAVQHRKNCLNTTGHIPPSLSWCPNHHFYCCLTRKELFQYNRAHTSLSLLVPKSPNHHFHCCPTQKELFEYNRAHSSLSLLVPKSPLSLLSNTERTV